MTSKQISALKRLPAEVGLEPIYNALNSMALLNLADGSAQLGEWVQHTASELTAEQRHTNQVLFEGLREVLSPDREVPDFSAYLEYLTAQNPFVLRDRALARLSQAFSNGEAAAEPSALLADVAQFITRLERLRGSAGADRAVYAEAHALLNNPPAMHDLIVMHLEQVWEAGLAPEWQQLTRGRMAALQVAISVYTKLLSPATPGPPMSQWARPGPEGTRQLDPGSTAGEALREFTGRTLPPSTWVPPANVERIVLIPSGHTGRHVSTWYADGTLRVFFTPPAQVAYLLRASQPGHAEVLARVSALADDTRLRILELIAEHDELSSQEVIARLNLTQSTVSRHLKQLQVYLTERRGEGANKIYSLNPIQLNVTIRALERLAAGVVEAHEEQESGEQQSELPIEVRKFLNRQGRITRWPEKYKDQRPLLGYLATKFEAGRSYTEKQVNEVLQEQITFDDYVTLRRGLIDLGFLGREADGSRYWRIEEHR
jgi:DNA-binding MarR family transcriptional regulator